MLHSLCFDGLTRAAFFQEVHIAEATRLFPRFENAALRGSFRAGVLSSKDPGPGPKMLCSTGFFRPEPRADIPLQKRFVLPCVIPDSKQWQKDPVVEPWGWAVMKSIGHFRQAQ